MNQKTSPAGIDLLARFEGCRLTAYRDAATPPIATIGYGHTGAGVCMGQTITRLRAEQLLAADLLTFEIIVDNAVTVPLTQGQFDACVSFC
jgi:lysozyme